jgi:hypothetical protein
MSPVINEPARESRFPPRSDDVPTADKPWRGMRCTNQVDDLGMLKVTK